MGGGGGGAYLPFGTLDYVGTIFFMLLRGEKIFQQIIQGNDSTLPMGPLGEFFKELSFGE